MEDQPFKILKLSSDEVVLYFEPGVNIGYKHAVIERFADAGHFVLVLHRLPAIDSAGTTSKVSFSLAWDLLEFLIGGKGREQVFTPAVNELKADYARAAEYSGKWSQRWINLCFALRTAVLFVDCVVRCGLERVLHPLASLMPHRLVKWLKRS